MGCWDVNPRKSKRTPEEIARFLEKAKQVGLMPKHSEEVPEGSIVLVDYLSLMK